MGEREVHTRGSTGMWLTANAFDCGLKVDGSTPHGVTDFCIPPYLFLSDAHVVLDIGEYGGLDEESFVAHTFAAGDESGAFLLARLDHAENLGHLIVVDLQSLHEYLYTTKETKPQQLHKVYLTAEQTYLWSLLSGRVEGIANRSLLRASN
jgi:hypothetical protein